MRRFIYLISVLSFLFFFPFVCFSQERTGYYDNGDLLQKRNISVLAIGIRDYGNRGKGRLMSANILNDYNDSIIQNNLNYEFLPPLIGTVTANSVSQQLADLTGRHDLANQVVIIHIIGHGKVENGKYLLMCSDDDIPGDDIVDCLKYIANQGALVVLFLNTCYSGALLDKYTPSIITGDGAIAFFGSSSRQDTTPELDQKTELSKYILEVFKNMHPGAYESRTDVLSLGSLEDFIKTNVKKPTPFIEFFTKEDGEEYKGYNIYGYPIMSKPNTNIRSTGTEGGKGDSLKINPQFYLGAAFGYPYASFFAGLSLWQHLKIEIGCSYLNAKESDDVYLYSSTNPSPFGYRYSTNNLRLYLQSGWEFDLGKDWYLTPMVGVSYLSLSGNPISGYKSDSGIGNGASAVCLTTNARLSFAPFKNKHWELSVTAGKEWGVGDSNYKLIRDYIDHKAIEGFRGQLGITYNF